MTKKCTTRSRNDKTAHSAGDIDTPEFRIVWDADWLVNIPDEFDISDGTRISELIEEVFKTDRGKRIAETLFLERSRP